jgi:AcrR family transcriptional regulator
MLAMKTLIRKPENSPYHHGNLRESLIAAALLRLDEQRGEALSLRELAKTVGVSIAAVYRHFSSKDALLAEVAVDGFERLVALWERTLPSLADVGAEQRFQRLGESYITFALAAPALYRLMFVHDDVRQFPALQAAGQHCFQYVLRTAADAVREAGAQASWALPAANAAWSLAHGYVMLSLSGRLTATDKKPDLSPASAPRFLQLPKEALKASLGGA